MRLAALYDIHGNSAALEAVLSEVEEEGVEHVVVGGDFIGPWPVLELLLRLGDRVCFIRGNVERELVAPRDYADASPPFESLEWLRGRLTEEERRFIGALPEQQRFELAGLGSVLACHATPRNDTEILTAASPEERWREVLVGVPDDVVLCGHTHMQFDRVVDGVRVVNAGSVGMPYEDVPGAYWALLGDGVALRTTPYDVEAAVAEIERAGFPGGWPRSTRAEATASFEGLARG